MAIQQAKLNQVKSDATIAIARAKAHQQQVNANVQVLKAKRMINRPRSQG